MSQRFRCTRADTSSNITSLLTHSRIIAPLLSVVLYRTPVSVCTASLATQQLSNNTPHKHLCHSAITHYRCSHQVCCRLDGVLQCQTLFLLARLPAIVVMNTQTDRQTDTFTDTHQQHCQQLHVASNHNTHSL